MTISSALERVYASAPNDDRYIETLELTHPGFTTGAVYLTNEADAYDAFDENAQPISYAAVPFGVIAPRAGDEVAMELQVALDNVGGVLMAELEAVAAGPTDPIKCIYRLYLASDNTTVQNKPPLTLDVLVAVATDTNISFKAGQSNLRAKPFPTIIYNVDLYPGLNR